MEIKNIIKNTSNFVVKRFIEAFGLLISISSLLLLVSLLSYSGDDQPLIFENNPSVKNLLGQKGSFISDLFFQSIGLISILVSLTIFITGINIIRTKKFLLILQNFFYLILYTILGSLFFTFFYPESFWLAINGNGGFFGKLLNESFLSSLININKQISFILLILTIFIIFLISIKF